MPTQAQGICGQLQCRKSGKVAKTPRHKCPRGKSKAILYMKCLYAQVRHECLLTAYRHFKCKSAFYLPNVQNMDKFALKISVCKIRALLVHIDTSRTKLHLICPRGHLCLGVFATFPDFLHCSCPQMPCPCMGNLQTFLLSFLNFCILILRTRKMPSFFAYLIC